MQRPRKDILFMNSNRPKAVGRCSLTPDCDAKPPVPDDNAQTILHSQETGRDEHIQLLINTIDRLSEHVELDGQLSALQLARGALIEEAQARTHVQLTLKSVDELTELQAQLYSLTGTLGTQLLLSD